MICRHLSVSVLIAGLFLGQQNAVYSAFSAYAFATAGTSESPSEDQEYNEGNGAFAGAIYSVSEVGASNSTAEVVGDHLKAYATAIAGPMASEPDVIDTRAMSGAGWTDDFLADPLDYEGDDFLLIEFELEGLLTGDASYTVNVFDQTNSIIKTLIYSTTEGLLQDDFGYFETEILSYSAPCRRTRSSAFLTVWKYLPVPTKPLVTPRLTSAKALL